MISKKRHPNLKPRFIALASSPIPYMNGTDFPAIAEVTEQDTGIPTFAVPTNGMHDYVHGAGMALEAIAEHFVNEDRLCRGSIRLIAGMTRLKQELKMKGIIAG